MAVHQSQQGAILSSSDRGGIRIQYSKNPFGRKRDVYGNVVEGGAAELGGAGSGGAGGAPDARLAAAQQAQQHAGQPLGGGGGPEPMVNSAGALDVGQHAQHPPQQ